MKKTCLLLAAAALTAGSISTSQAQIAIAGAFNGWDNTGVPSPGGGPLIYTNIMTGGTPGNIDEFKWIANSGSWSLTYPGGGNQKVPYDAGGSNTVYLYSGPFVDGWNPVANRVGYEDPGGMTWELAGSFNGWSGGAGWNLNSIGNGVYSNTIVFPTAGSYEGKFRKQGSWDYEFGNDGNNIPIITTTSPQSISIQLDVQNGRYTIGEPVPVLATNTVVFAVDMSVQIALGYFHPDQGYTVFASGSFNSWPGPGGGLALTNYPPYNGGSNTNIFYGTNYFVHTASPTSYSYKFNQNDPAAPNSGWETSGDRSISVPGNNSYTNLPAVFFSDTGGSDYLAAPLNVTFRVDMNGRTNIYGVTWTGQAVYINGNFRPGGWSGTWNSLALSQMFEEGTGSGIYTNTFEVPVGSPVNIKYKYSFDDGVNSFDNEATSGQDHGRTIRTTVTGSYALATDTFGDQYVEPSFGQLSVGPASGGTAPLSWLGRPGVMVQQSTDVTGPWTTLTNTDGTQWDIGSYSTNGLVSATNVPTSGSATFYRLIKP